jgi:hypothetical protein
VTITDAIGRIQEIQALLTPRAAAPASGGLATATLAGTATAGGTSATAGSPFAAALRQASVTSSAVGAGPRMVQAAQTQLGVAEQPPGSNDAPAIRTYRGALQSDPGVGPWCAMFVSWAAQQAGTPLGDTGGGFASVDQMWAWAQRSGHALPAGATPQVGDIIVLNQHTGLVTGVRPDGRIETIEGNTSDRVATRDHAPGEAIGYIRMGR